MNDNLWYFCVAVPLAIFFFGTAAFTFNMYPTGTEAGNVTLLFFTIFDIGAGLLWLILPKLLK